MVSPLSGGETFQSREDAEGWNWAEIWTSMGGTVAEMDTKFYVSSRDVESDIGILVFTPAQELELIQGDSLGPVDGVLFGG